MQQIWSLYGARGSRALRLCCLLKPRRPSSLSGSASRTGSHQGKCIYVGWSLADGTSALITLGQRSSTDLFVNAQSGQILLEIDSSGSPWNPDKEPDHQAAKVLSERTGRQPALAASRWSSAMRSLGPVQRSRGGGGDETDFRLKLNQRKWRACPRVGAVFEWQNSLKCEQACARQVHLNAHPGCSSCA